MYKLVLLSVIAVAAAVPGDVVPAVVAHVPTVAVASAVSSTQRIDANVPIAVARPALAVVDHGWGWGGLRYAAAAPYYHPTTAFLAAPAYYGHGLYYGYGHGLWGNYGFLLKK